MLLVWDTANLDGLILASSDDPKDCREESWNADSWLWPSGGIPPTNDFWVRALLRFARKIEFEMDDPSAVSQ